jgi:hypothetical protein
MTTKQKLVSIAAILIGGVAVATASIVSCNSGDRTAAQVPGTDATVSLVKPAAAQSSSTAPAASTAATPAPTTPKTNPTAVPGAGQPSVKDISNNDAITKKCASLPVSIRNSLFFYGAEQSGSAPVLMRACNNPDFLTEKRGTWTLEGTTVRVGLEGDRQTCGPVKPWDTGPQPISQNEWISEESHLTEVFFKRFEGGTGTLVNWQVVNVSACTNAKVTPTGGGSCSGNSCGYKASAPATAASQVIWVNVVPPLPSTTVTAPAPTAPPPPPPPPPVKDPRYGM